MNVFILSLLSGLLLWPVVGSAELYKWTDAQGNFHITDTPPAVPQKKSVPPAVSASPSTPPHKTTIAPVLPESSRADVHPVPGSIAVPTSTSEGAVRTSLAGLSPNQATVTSSWQTFDGTQVSAKAPVQRWKDAQGLDHFVDVLPMVKK
jgi:cytoskeletal protein RodZ